MTLTDFLWNSYLLPVALTILAVVLFGAPAYLLEKPIKARKGRRD